MPPPKLRDLKLLLDDPRLLSVLPTLRELDGELNDRLGVGRVRVVLFCVEGLKVRLGVVVDDLSKLRVPVEEGRVTVVRVELGRVVPKERRAVSCVRVLPLCLLPKERLPLRVTLLCDPLVTGRLSVLRLPLPNVREPLCAVMRVPLPKWPLSNWSRMPLGR